MQNFDNFTGRAKSLLMKYKRYIGAVVLFVLFVLVLVNCTGPRDEMDKNTQVGTEIAPTQQHTEYELKGKLDKNASQELVDLINNYYTAYAAGDSETLEGFVSPLSDNEKSYMGALADYYEKYENVTCYSMQGATDDSYLVSVCYELKFYGVDTPAPGMDFFYVERDGKGNLCINNAYSSYNFNFLEEELDADLYALILEYEKSDEVKALQSEVQSRYDDAVAGDEKLANMVGGTLRSVIAKWRESVADTGQNDTTQETQQKDSTQSTETQTTDTKKDDKKKEDTQKADTTENDSKKEDTKKEDEKKKESKKRDSGKVKTKDICNVRAKASTDSEILGRVDIDVVLNKVGTSGDWTKVEFQGGTGYIKSDLLKAVK